MGLFSAVSNVGTISAGVVKTVAGLVGTSAKTVKKIFSSKVAKILGLGIGGMAIVNNREAIGEKFSNFFSAITNKIDSVSEKGVVKSAEETVGKGVAKLTDMVKNADPIGEEITRQATNTVDEKGDSVIQDSIENNSGLESGLETC